MTDHSTIYFINNNPKDGIKGIVEGGSSRLIAWETWLRKHAGQFADIRLRTGKIAHNLQVLSTLFFKRKATILFLYPVIGVPIFYLNSFEKIASVFFFLCLRKATKRNTVVFDISDLKYEQAIDLELMDTPFGIRGEEIEKKLFSTDARFIFASYHMQSYANQKYGIKPERTDVCINGGEPVNPETILPVQVDREKVNYVYSGTLNKGRQIEQLLEVFPEDERYHLYLLGPSGEWISDIHRNITYLGPVQEEIAHHFVSTCDAGLIPYDEKRLYYNLAYPTKLSFYITAQIPYISTPVDEVKDVDEAIHGGWLAPVSGWGELIQSISKEAIQDRKKHVMEHSPKYLWDNILSANHFIH